MWPLASDRWVGACALECRPQRVLPTLSADQIHPRSPRGPKFELTAQNYLRLSETLLKWL